MTKKITLNIVFMVLILIILGGCSEVKENDIGIEKDNPLLNYFEEWNPDNMVIKCAYEDVDNNNTKDLVVVYSVSKDKNKMKIVIDNNGKYEFTEEVDAPRENQNIKFKNIDAKDQIEIIVSGSKNGAVGYAIFRVVDMKIINLFGQDMEDCC
ncbi:Cys-Cys-COOH (seleno)protein SaoC [Tepidibacter mesophilus]|uniref:Cys-Cys-COOH (seleno)protein SaoC n=1 Tax=Tepidibacter mesophilus TaxID=655607 RepID=UPI000C07A250|nr:Cys-Cys-COOH (seleno)protein SaoC [Tepidibacter mesophilus]